MITQPATRTHRRNRIHSVLIGPPPSDRLTLIMPRPQSVLGFGVTTRGPQSLRAHPLDHPGMPELDMHIANPGSTEHGGSALYVTRFNDFGVSRVGDSLASFVSDFESYGQGGPK